MKNTNALLLVICISLLCITACKKNKTTPFTLSQPVVSGNMVTLTWSKLDPTTIYDYEVCIVTDSNVVGPSKIITVDNNTTTITDTLPAAPYVHYYVHGTPRGIPDPYYTNTVTVSRSDISFAYITPNDAVFDQANQKVYVFSSNGDIAAYDLLAKKWAGQIASHSGVGSCAMGVYNGKTELYVPRNDGWVFIYDAATLSQTDQINVGGAPGAVVYNNGILFVSSSSNSSTDNTVASYSRATKLQIAQTTISDFVMIKMLPGTNTDLYGMSVYSYPYHFSFDAMGHFNTQNVSFSASGGSYTGALEVAPDEVMITSNTGILINSSLSYITTLPHGDDVFTSYCFDNAGSQVYAGCTRRSINAYSMSTYQFQRAIPTQGYPYKLFYNSSGIISVSAGMPVGSTVPGMYTCVEQF